VDAKAETGVEEKPATHHPSKEETFVQVSLEIIERYRNANQIFLKKQFEASQAAFREVYKRASDLETDHGEQKEIQRHLQTASRARMEGLRYFINSREKPQDVQIGGRWNRNVESLKEANEAITQAVWQVGRMIQSQMNLGGEEKNSALFLQILEKNTKGILVVSKSAHS
jgi:hypothetical protein